MNLTESIQALEAKGITVAINLGTHQHCAIDSNCPLAVELRRLIVDAGVTLKELVEGFVKATAPDPVKYELPEISSKVSITVAGKTMEFELDDIISGEVKVAIDERFRAVDIRLREIRHLGGSLYTSYLRAITQARRTKTLPQLKFSCQELMKANCYITCDESSYIFLFPTEYHPGYLVKNDTREKVIRYKMADEDIEAIRQEAWIELTVRGDRFLNATLLDSRARGIEHYHGNRDGACWGSVRIPSKWDGTLKSLCELKTLIIGSLATINMSSLLNHNPSGMPSSDDIFRRGTKIGEEGTIATAPQPRDTAEEAPRAGWGARGEQTGTPEEERRRRWGTTDCPQDFSLICLVCGEDAGRHYQAGLVCPRDRRRE